MNNANEIIYPPPQSTFKPTSLSLPRTGLKPPSRRRKPAVTKTPTPALTTYAASAYAFTVHNVPAISVVIPMYNAGKYIGECIESILNQTFKNFELIIVDDFSKDNSYAIVKSYIPKSDGRLKLAKLEKNSGGAPVPRNKGITIARGEYFFFMDADDVLLPKALEKLYAAAKEFDADIVHLDKWYSSPGESASTDESILTITSNNMVDTIEEPTLDTNLLSERVTKMTQYRFWWAPWSHLVRRKFMLDNGIKFQKLNIADDLIFTTFIYFLADKVVNIPGAYYVWRILENSNCHIDWSNTPFDRLIHRRVNDIFLGIQVLTELTGRFELFQDEPAYRYDLINFFVQAQINNIYELYNQFPVVTFDSYIRKEFAEIGNDPVVAAFLFNRMMTVDENSMTNQQKHKTIINRLTARLDIRLLAEGNFQILDISDAEATLIKPNWLRYGGGWGYMLTSYAGELEFVAKASVDGEIELILRGMDIRDPQDESKRIPQWIDYTALVVNGKTIFDKFMPVWHDEPYFYKINAKADEDIKIKLEWLPHKKTLAESRPALQVPDKFKGFLTARLDVRLMDEKGDFQILDISDAEATLIKPNWLRYAGGWGYMLASFAGELEFVAKAAVDGEIEVILRGMDIRDPQDESKRIPYWIDYTRLIVNGEVMFDTLTPVWHDEPYFCKINAKAGEDIKIKVEWLPHKKESTTPRPAPKIPDAPKDILPSRMDVKVLSSFLNAVQVPDKFKDFLTARIDFKLMAEGDLQILNVADNKAKLTKPKWLQGDGVGYMITSYAGALEFVAKAKMDGEFCIWLRGLDVRDPQDESKRIPQWIDYTRLIINDKTIFNTLTPVWHNEPYFYSMNAKTNEDIKVKVEWLPHKKELSVPADVPQVPDKFKPYFTARIDVKLLAEGDFQILAVSDDTATVTKPKWFQKDGTGYQIESYVGKLEFVSKAAVDGQIELRLRGIWVPNPADKAKLIPYWIDYTSLRINGKTLFDTVTPAWHDKPYSYNMNVKAGEKIKLQVEWLPHRSNP